MSGTVGISEEGAAFGMRRVCVLGLLATLYGTACACSTIRPEEGGWVRREYEVVEDLDIPEKLKQKIEAEKAEPFYLTYGEGKWLYICRGYGVKETGGYTVNVEEFSETDKFLYLDTSLTGPTKEEAEEGNSFPYLVIRTARCEKQTSFV